MSKTVRIVVRVTPDIKQEIAYAAMLEQMSVGAFIERSAVQSADEVIQRHEIISLSERASHALIDSFFNPHEPSESLRRAKQFYASLIVPSAISES